MTPDPPRVGVGMLGYAFMGKAHANAYRALGSMTWPPPATCDLVAVAGRDESKVTEAARRYGFARAVTDWRELVEDPAIDVFDNVAPNHLHAEPTIAAAQAGKHVVCEKPLGRSADEALDTWQKVQATGVKHLCAFNYRFVPAVRLARQLIAAGEIGEVRHFRGAYLQDWLADPHAPLTWRLEADTAGSGALGDLGAHVVDLARHLVDEIGAVSAQTTTFVAQRPGGAVTVDDAFAAIATFDNGAVGTLEASRVALGHKNALTFEVNGTKGTIGFALERLNELEVDGRTVLVTEPEHPFMEHWWPPGHVIGWEHTFVHELHHFLTAIRDDGDVRPDGADFEDGYRAAEVCDAIARSSRSGARETISYRGAP